MSVIEKSGVMKYKDKDGQVYIMLPITTADKVDGAVSFYEQELTEEEKAQARANIGAISANEVPESGGSEQVQSDYEQNDSSAMDFIKNRPFYGTAGETIFDGDVTTTNEESNSSNYASHEHSVGLYGDIIEGDKVTIVYNGVYYSCVAKANVGEGIYLGNISIFGVHMLNDLATSFGQTVEELLAEDPSFEIYMNDTGEPFYLTITTDYTLFTTKEPGTYHFTINKGEFKQLDEKYIPDTIARVSDIPTGGADIDLTNIPNLYTWKRYSSSPKEYTETENTEVIIGAAMGSQTSLSAYYADNISIVDGAFDSNGFTDSGQTDITTLQELIKGKYVRYGTGNTGSPYKYYYIPEDVTLSYSYSGYNVVGVRADKAYLLGVNANIGTFIDLVASETNDAYPTSGQHTDGYWYEYYKLLGSNGIYIGSGDMPEGCVIQIDPDGEYEGDTSEGNGSGKTLIGEVILTSSNVTKTEDNMLTFNDELEAQLTEILSAIDESRGIIYVEQTILDMVNTSICSYMSDSVDLVTKKTIDFAFLNDAATGSVMYNSLRADNLRFNISGYYDYVVSGDLTISMKFYTISGGSSSDSGDTSVAEEELPAVTTEDNGKVLMVVDGKWAIGSLSTSGAALPSAEEASF